MKNWQATILDHHNATVLNESQVFIPSVAWIPETGERFDHIVTRDTENSKYIIEEYKQGTNELTNTEYEEESIYCYLGY